MNTQKIIQAHIKKYPQLLPADLFKFLYQSTFGCEHMVTSLEDAILYIKEEAKNVDLTSTPYIEQLDGDFSRVSLSYINKGLSAETFGKLFYFSSKESKKDISSLEAKLKYAIETVKNGNFAFTEDEFLTSLFEWKQKGYSSLHHSKTFKSQYAPSYRVISNKYIPFLPLFCLIDKKLSTDKIILSIEGGSASGKTTLSGILKEIYGCNVFHTDDYFLQPHQRTEKRLMETGGNLDRERFLSEIITPLLKNKTIAFRRFDCASMKLMPEKIVSPSPFTVVEGVYSMHPYFSDYYNISVFLQTNPQTQKDRIIKRNPPPLAKRFFSEWIPMENRYFEEFDIKNKCDIIIE